MGINLEKFFPFLSPLNKMGRYLEKFFPFFSPLNKIINVK